MEDLKCQRCGYLWNSTVLHPAQCPKCKSPRWESPRKSKAELEQRIKELEKTLADGRHLSLSSNPADVVSNLMVRAGIIQTDADRAALGKFRTYCDETVNK